jgi:spore germination protein GerM
MHPRRSTTFFVVLALLSGALVLVGCGGDSTPAPSQGNGARVTRTTVYFLVDGRSAPIGVRRVIQAESPYAVRALEALLAGPTAAERARGITTAIPEGAEILGYELRGVGGTGAVLDLSGLPVEADVFTRIRIITQIARTVLGVSGLHRIWLESQGEPWGTLLRNGEVRSEPYEYESLFGWVRVCEGKAGTEAVPARCFSALP